MSIGFARNFTHVYEVQDPKTGQWMYLGPGISNISDNSDDETDDTAYYDSQGAQPEDVTGSKVGYTVEGHRYHGDPAQDFIASKKYTVGDDRIVPLRHIAPDGSMLTGQVTLLNIKDGGGEANEKGEFGCDMTYRSMPTFTPPQSKDMPESISFEEELTVEVGQTLDLSTKLKVEPEGATPNAVFALADESMDMAEEGGTAMVDAAGILTAKKAGKVKVTAKCVSKPSATATAEVTISGGA